MCHVFLKDFKIAYNTELKGVRVINKVTVILLEAEGD